MSDVLSLTAAPVANVLASIPLGSIPSPSVSYLQLGPFRVHFYALCILAGMAVCLWLGSRRWKAAGGTPERVFDVAMWAIPAGIIGARAYHVLITDPGSYFGPNVADPWAFLKIWEGGIGIMGAVSVGALGAWYGCRRYGMNFPAFADAVAPGILLAQAFGRWGNWFNQELFGKPTTLPWGLEISASSGNSRLSIRRYAVPSDVPVRVAVEPAGCGVAAVAGQEGRAEAGSDPVAVRVLLRRGSPLYRDVPAHRYLGDALGRSYSRVDGPASGSAGCRGLCGGRSSCCGESCCWY